MNKSTVCARAVKLSNVGTIRVVYRLVGQKKREMWGQTGISPISLVEKLWNVPSVPEFQRLAHSSAEEIEPSTY